MRRRGLRAVSTGDFAAVVNRCDRRLLGGNPVVPIGVLQFRDGDRSPRDEADQLRAFVETIKRTTHLDQRGVAEA